jgi:uncharacterized protein (TIGR03435 family)
MIPDNFIAAMVDHLWQSTAVAGTAWMLTLALRKNHARTRYWVWIVASIKFLVPISLFIAVGEGLRSMVSTPIEKPVIAVAMEKITQPFQQPQFFETARMTVSAHRPLAIPALMLAIWVCGAFFVAVGWVRAWLQVRSAVRKASPLAIAADIPARLSTSLMEPGIVGIFRPVLILPKGIVNRLTPEQLDAIVAHEICHVRNRDNLTYALHIIVETLFWFYPPVWWIGTRLIDERERACDEAVLQAGSEAQVYAEGILNVCKFYVESPIACTAGVTGSDLKKRIVRIMTRHVTRNLDLSRKFLLSAAALAAVALPLALGLVRVSQVRAQGGAENATADLPRYDVASIKPFKPAGMMMQMGMRMNPDGISATGLSLSMLLHQTFGVSDDRIQNEPEWARSDRFDIDAKVAPSDAPKLKDLDLDQRWAMMLPVLQDRFALKFHRETKDVEVYTLVVAKGGARLQAAKPPIAGELQPMDGLEGKGGPATPNGAPSGIGGMGRSMMRISPQGMTLDGQGATMEQLVHTIAQQMGSTVVDKTGLTGTYDYTLTWMPERGAGPMMRTPDGGPPPSGGESATTETGPSLFSALQDQLGLKLVAQKVQMDVIVIDHIEQPSPN